VIKIGRGLLILDVWKQTLLLPIMLILTIVTPNLHRRRKASIHSAKFLICSLCTN